MKYELKTVTPLHIGTGSKYSGAEFILKDGKLYRVSLDKLLKKLSASQIEDLTDRLEDYRFSLTDFLRGKDINLADIAKYVSKFEGDRGVKEISEQIKTTDRAYLPGSSIKGAIRTAIIYKILKEDYSILDNELKRIKNNRRLMDNLNRNMTRSPAFKDKRFSKELGRVMSAVEGKVLRGIKNDAKYDLLKFLQITDSSTTERLSILTVKSVGMSQEGRSYSQIEAIEEGVVLDGSVLLNPIELNEIGLSSKAKYLDKNFILNAIYTFAEDLKKLEMEYAKEHNLDVNYFYESEFDNQPNSPLLRMGADKGFLSNTIDLLIRINDPDFYRYLRFAAYRSYPDEFPKTRKFVLEDGKPKYPPGWVKLKIGD
ncbi:type III-A CRISPR-associated RAMP protein Csm5 [ANME-1 cluster archaeon GoMg4]|nr:type III-A CRISPR-associated RAMP protein Csm5 [ANME-1 cluster archaeon GoMg4]